MKADAKNIDLLTDFVNLGDETFIVHDEKRI